MPTTTIHENRLLGSTVRRALAVASALGALAALPPAASAAEPVIRGRILGPGDAPIASARVSLHPLLDPASERLAWLAGDTPRVLAESLTGADGTFRLVAPDAGFYVVAADAPGFVAMSARLEPLVEDLVLEDAVLASDEGLAVSVVDSAGAGVANALVRLHRDQGSGLAARLAQQAGRWSPSARPALTDASGKARLERGARDGAMDVLASAPERGFATVRAPRGGALTIALPDADAVRAVVRDAAGALVPYALLVSGDDGAHPLGLAGESGALDLALAVDPDDPPRLGAYAPDGTFAAATIEPAPPPREGEAPAARWRAAITMPALASLDGRVVDALDGRSIPGALVFVPDTPWRHARAGVGGAFQLESVPRNDVPLVAQAPSYLVPDRLLARRGRATGQATATIALTPASAIEGVVTDESGRPIAGARVTTSPGGGRLDRIEIRIGGRGPAGPTATTAQDGRFRLAPVDARQPWRLEARATGFARAQKDAPALRPRETARDVRLVLPRGTNVRGRVRDDQGRAIAGVVATLAPARPAAGPGMMVIAGPRADRDAALGATSSADGTFVIEGAADGRYELSLTRRGYAGRTIEGLEIEGGAPLETGDHVLAPGESIEGFVQDERGVPIEGAAVYRQKAGGFSLPMLPGLGSEPAAATTGPDGWFAIHDLAAGDKLSLSISADGYVQGRVPPLEVPHPEPLQVTLEPASAVRGRVLGADGSPLADARVELTRTTGGTAGGASLVMRIATDTETDANGAFSFENVVPGEIELSATAFGHERVVRTLEVPRGADLENADLPLEAGAWIEGRVQEGDGRAAIGVRVQPVGGGDDFAPGGGGATTDGDGRYVLDGLAPGPLSIEAIGDGEKRTVRDVELRAGENRLDLQFAAGRPVAGIVTDASGTPIPGAWVQLAPSARPWGGSSARTDASGRFRFEAVDRGTFELRAGADGHADAAMQEITVGEAPQEDLALRLRMGGTIEGRVVGLDPVLFPRTVVTAFGEGAGMPRRATVDADGRFVVTNVGPGAWQLSGDVEGEGRRARAQVGVDEDGSVVTAELDFAEGLELTGVVLQDDRPLAGLSVMVRGQGAAAASGGWTETDGSGRFALRGLASGTHRVQVQDWQSGMTHSEDVLLESDRDVEIEIPTTSLSGVVVDAFGDDPLAGVALALEREGASEGGLGGSVFGVGATSDLDGRFRIAPVGEGRYRLTASKDGYAVATRSIAVVSGSSQDGLELRLDPTEGVLLQVALDSGSAPDRVSVAVLDPSGTPLVAGEYGTGEKGRVRLASVPPGSWEIVAATGASASVSTLVSAPGGPFTVRLPSAARLSVRVPKLEESSTTAVARVTLDSGRPFRSVAPWSGVRGSWPLSAGRGAVTELPPGRHRVTVTAADGRTWSGEATVAAGESTSVTLGE